MVSYSVLWRWRPHDLYNILSVSSFTWICCDCGFPNFSNSFFDSSVETIESENSFEVLNTTSESNTSNNSDCETRKSNTYKNKHKRRSKATKCKLTCLAVNCQSIKNKVADIAAIVEEYNPDIILGNESWLNPDIKSSEMFPKIYNVYRKDRQSDSHGDVFQAVKKDIIVTHRDDLNTDCELIWTQCQIQNKKSKSLFLASFYRPNKNNISSF